MHATITQLLQVFKGEKVEIPVPGLIAGTTIEVTVRVLSVSEQRKRNMGYLRGKIKIGPGFDEPLEEFEPYL